MQPSHASTSHRFEGRLANYAIGWIRWHIQDYIRRNAAPVRLPATTGHRQLAQMAGRLFADARKSCHREAVEATEAELCERIGRRIGWPATRSPAACRLDQRRDGQPACAGDPGGTTRNLEDTIAADTASPEEDVILRLDHAKARKRIMAAGARDPRRT